MPKDSNAPDNLTDALKAAGAVAETEAQAAVEAGEAHLAQQADEHIVQPVMGKLHLLEQIEQHIEIWFQDTRRNLASLETEAHNKLFNAKEELKQRLRGLIA